LNKVNIKSISKKNLIQSNIKNKKRSEIFSSFHEHNFMKHIKINIILRVIKLYTRKNLFNEIEHKKIIEQKLIE
jgi:hypothetical protein